MQKTLITLTVAAMAATAVPATAETVGVQYRDLNLETSEGQRALERRIDKAARTACGITRHETGSRLRSRSAADCHAKAKKQAMSQLAAVIEERQLGG